MTSNFEPIRKTKRNPFKFVKTGKEKSYKKDRNEFRKFKESRWK